MEITFIHGLELITTYHLLTDPQGAFKLDKMYSGICFEEFDSGDFYEGFKVHEIIQET